MPNLDFTQGGKIPEGAKHDWNLGATGLRGWIYCDKMVTSDARQIAITKVEKGSPADGVLAVGDVILGFGGKPFSYDPRTEMGKALTLAESEAGQGKLSLTRWRAGVKAEVVVKLPVLGTYSATAPYNCPKSKRVLEQGCKDLAKRMAHPSYAEHLDPIPRSLNALALLASGDRGYLPLIKKEAQWAANFSDVGMQTWYYGYVMLFLSEYTMATGDGSLMPGLKRLALEAAHGQSAVGSWGHGFATPDGRLGGYGMMNAPGVPLTISLVLAREAGVKDPALDLAIERSAKLLRFYIGKGAIPYGDHHPCVAVHDDNGKCGMGAVLFNLLGEAKGAEFFSRISVASHGPERDCGHCGNFFNLLWAVPGVALSGPNATGAWMTEFGTWYFDLARGANGNFIHQGPPENEEDSYEGWDATGAYLLAYAMPLKKLLLTGKKPGPVPQLDAAAAQSLIMDGRGWNSKDGNSFYDALSDGQLLERLGSWAPVVRERAAMALGRRKNAPVAPLVQMLDSPSIEARYGACQGLIFLRERGAPAVDALRKTLAHQDLWLRIKAAEALAAIGAPASKAVPQLLEMLAQVDVANDPRGMQQRYLSIALFDEEDNGMLSQSLAGVDRDALHKAVRAGLKNQDGRARGSMSSVYRHLSLEEIKPLLPAIHEAIVQPAPSGEMFADTIRVEGLRLLAKHRIEEGIRACVNYTRDQNPWASEERTPEIMKILLTYGTHAKTVIPELTRIADYFEKDEKDFPEELMRMKAKSVRQTIREIKASKESPKLIRLFPAAAPAPGAQAPAAQAKPMKVFILAGQSNMEGHAEIGTFDYIGDDPATAPLLKRMRGPDGKPRVCDHAYISYFTGGDTHGEGFGKLTAGYGAREIPTEDGGKIGPEFTFGIAMDDAFDEPVLLIKTAWGGKSLFHDFRPPSAGVYPRTPKDIKEDRYHEAKSGHYYRLMIEHVRKVLADPKRVCPEYDAAQGFEVAGFVWLQGWNDMVDYDVYPELPTNSKKPRFAKYSECLAAFIRDVRKDLNVPKMPFVIGVMGVKGTKPDEEIVAFREAMTAPSLLPEFQGNVAAVQTAPFWSMELGAIDEKHEQVDQMRYFLDSKHKDHPNAKGKMTKRQKEAYVKSFEAKLISPAEAALWKRGASNAGYHYLGCAKTFALMGDAFAQALLDAMKQRP